MDPANVIQTCIQDGIQTMYLEKMSGWTISDWQRAYQTGEINIEKLCDLVSEFDPQDNAWISIATVEQIKQQIEDLQIDTHDLENIYLQFPLQFVSFVFKY